MKGSSIHNDVGDSRSGNTSTVFVNPDEIAGKEQEGKIGAIEMDFGPIGGEDLLEGFDFDLFGKGE